MVAILHFSVGSFVRLFVVTVDDVRAAGEGQFSVENRERIWFTSCKAEVHGKGVVPYILHCRLYFVSCRSDNFLKGRGL